jgi:hypothetical protein
MSNPAPSALRGEILIYGDAITEVGAKVPRPSRAEIIDLGNAALLPGLIFKRSKNRCRSAPSWPPWPLGERAWVL